MNLCKICGFEVLIFDQTWNFGFVKLYFLPRKKCQKWTFLQFWEPDILQRIIFCSHSIQKVPKFATFQRRQFSFWFFSSRFKRSWNLLFVTMEPLFEETWQSIIFPRNSASSRPRKLVSIAAPFWKVTHLATNKNEVHK